jgi:hypothetical protein
MNINDPKLTAFALHELDEPEKSTIAREIAESSEAQRVVDETRQLARVLKNEFAAEMVNEEPVQAQGRRNLSDIRDDPWFWLRARPLAIAAGLAICAILSVLLIANYHTRSRTPVPANYAVIEGEQNPDETTSELAVPDRITTPWRSEAIRRIERVVIGDINGDTGSENGEVRVIEVIDDVYRVERLKQRLTNSVLSEKLHRQFDRGYKLIFLDGVGEIVASAAFCFVPEQGFVLRPLRNAYERGGRYFIGGDGTLPGDWKTNVNYRAYAIPFPDWYDCIGYAPGA